MVTKTGNKIKEYKILCIFQRYRKLAWIIEVALLPVCPSSMSLRRVNMR
jgi:hypothetical protein